MYELKITPFGSHRRYELTNPVSGNGFSIVPSAGANVLEIRFGGRQILDGYDSSEALEAGKWGKSTVLFPFPNRLDRGRYTWQGQSYQFPLNNAATENAIHGFVREEAFEVQHVFLSRDAASIRCFFDYDGRRPYYPFPFSLELEFTIFDDGTFRLELEVDNLGDASMPFGFGWHPYFKLAAQAAAHRLQLPPCEMVAINERMIPTGGRSAYTAFQKIRPVGDTFLDNCFQHLRVKGAPRLVLKGTEGTLRVTASAQKFPFFQVFTPPHGESIALEPMTCNVDALNNQQGLVALAAGKKWKGWMACQFISH